MPLADWEPRQHAGQAVLGGRAPHFRTATPRITESVTEPDRSTIHSPGRRVRGHRDRLIARQPVRHPGPGAFRAGRRLRRRTRGTPPAPRSTGYWASSASGFNA